MQKKCVICKELFKPTRVWNKYCKKPECQREANRRRVKKHRKNDSLRVNNLEEMKTKEPYKSNYEKIMKAYLPDAPFLDLFKDKRKYLKRQQKRFEKKTYSYFKKETGLSLDTVIKYINRLIEFGEIQEYTLDIINELEPLRIWFKSFIEHSPTKNILALENVTVFNKNIIFEGIQEKELSRIRDSLYDLQESHFKFCGSIWRIGLRKANDLWIDFIDKVEISNNTKMYFWLELLRIHFLATDRYITMEWSIKTGITEYGDYRKGMVYPVNRDIIEPLKFHNYKKNLSPWTEHFTTLFHKVISKYYNDEVETVKKDFFEICNSTLHIREKVNDFITVFRPEVVSYLSIRDQYRSIYGMDEVGKLMESTRENKEPQTKPNTDNDLEDFLQEKWEPLKELNLFNGLNDEIIKLGFQDVQHLYDELWYLADTFQMP